MNTDKECVKVKTLIVDDSQLVCEMFSNTLCKKGYETTTANDGESALKKLIAENFQVMLLDLVLPGINGMDVLRECRKNNHEICIIVVTSYGSEATAVEAIQEGADDYVVKDFMLMNDAKSLDVVISRGLERRRLAMENIELNKQLKELNLVLQTAYAREKEEKDYIRNLFGSTTFAVVLSNDNGNILGFDDAFVKMTGFPEKELFNMCLFDLIRSEFRSNVEPLFKKIQAGAAQGIKARIIAKSQKDIDVTLNTISFKMTGERLVLTAIVTSLEKYAVPPFVDGIG
ncbi:MAG TPA: response regulator [Candidatus Wunengus sp. YC60]|uniref:response regulator n=1 Tax=Candidatus Wunengus sp. YC60 TaxID=3367697 RepID=UPI0040252F2F